MGSGGYSSRDFDTYATTHKLHDPTTRTEDIYKSRDIDPMLDPKKFQMREAVDGPDNPESTPIIICLDVSGSMASVLDNVARKGLKTLCEEIYNRKPVTNPHICIAAVDDVEMGDPVPFQATQFEADVRVLEQLAKIYLEQRGGGNDHESYILAYYFAKFRTKTDSFTKRGKKGFLITVGDEEITPILRSSNFEAAMGDKGVSDYTAKELFNLVYPEWNVYHIILKQGSHAQAAFSEVKQSWDDVLGAQRVIALDDYTLLGETIVSLLELMAGKSLKEVKDSWDGTTAVSIGNALREIEAPKGGAVASVDQYL